MKSGKVKESVFRFREFSVSNRHSAMKVGTDGVLLGAWALLDTGFYPGVILDAGTGTGVIALMMAQRFPAADITGVEVDTVAAAEATANFAGSPWPDRLRAVNGEFGNFCRRLKVDAGGKIDLLISNPPFFHNGPEAPDAVRSAARHEGALSPVALIRAAGEILSPEGRLCFISTEDTRDNLEFEAALAGLVLERRTMVATGEGKPPRRVLWQFARRGVSPSFESGNLLTIRRRSGEPTSEYYELVEPYYLYVK